MMQILIVEDEPKIAEFVRRGLQEEHYVADIAENGEVALEKYEVNQYDLILLDIMLPKIDGIEVCKRIRQKDTTIPILMLTAKSGIDDTVTGLDAGADDYLTKPFSFAVLSARIRALLRRGKKAADPTILNIDTLELNPAMKTVTRNGKTVHVTMREYALLEYFLRNQNILLSKTQLLEHVWDYTYDGISNIVETYVKYVRKKIQTSPTDKELIHTRRGGGYIMTLNM